MVPVHGERPSYDPMATRRENNRSRFVMSLLLESLEPRRAPKPRTPRPPVAKRSRDKRLLLEEFEDRVLPTFTLGAAANYAILFEGGGSNNTLDIKQGTTNITGSGPGQGGGIGNIGIGMAGQSKVTGNSTINGRIDFSASNTAQFSSDRGNAITGGVNYNVAAVTSALSTVNALNTTLGALPGPSPTINGNTTINAINGTLLRFGTWLHQCEGLQYNRLQPQQRTDPDDQRRCEWRLGRLELQGQHEFPRERCPDRRTHPGQRDLQLRRGRPLRGGPHSGPQQRWRLVEPRSGHLPRPEWHDQRRPTPTSSGASSAAIAGISSSTAPTSPPPSTPRVRPSPRPPARPRSRWARTP